MPRAGAVPEGEGPRESSSGPLRVGGYFAVGMMYAAPRRRFFFMWEFQKYSEVYVLFFRAGVGMKGLVRRIENLVEGQESDGRPTVTR